MGRRGRGKLISARLLEDRRARDGRSGSIRTYPAAYFIDLYRSKLSSRYLLY